MQSHQRYFPLGGNRFAFVANGGDPERRAGRATRACSRGGSRTRASPSSATSASGSTRSRSGSARSRSSPGRASFADKTERLRRLVGELGGGEATREAARLAKADQAAELVREFPDLEGYIGAEYARLAGYPEAVCGAIEEQYLPDAAGGPLPETESGRVLAAADKIDNARDVVLARPPSDRLARPVRAAARCDRPATVLGRARAGLAVAALARSRTTSREFVEERLEGLLDVPVEFVRAARASAAPDLGGVARLAQALHEERESPAFDGVYTAYDARAPARGTLGRRRRRRGRPRVAEGGRGAGACRRAGAGSGRRRRAASARSRARRSAPLIERFFDEVLVMDEDDAVRANRLRLLLDVRDTLGRLGDFSQIPR